MTAEQELRDVVQLQRSGDEAGAMQAANEAATKGFDDPDPPPEREHGHAGDLGRQDSAGIQINVDAVLSVLVVLDMPQEMLIKAEAAFQAERHLESAQG
ncbi:hypothetical protein ACLB1O_09340 [Escherichia coli]